MKKIVMVILSIMLILLTSCGTAASEASEKAISAGKAAISIGNDYLGHKLTADEAQKKIDDLENQISYARNETKADGSPKADLKIYGDIVLLHSRILSDTTKNGNNENYENIKKRYKENRRRY